MYRNVLVWLGLVVGIISVVQARPTPSEAHVSIKIPATTAALADMPVTVQLKFSSADEQTIASDAFDFILLADDGTQVAQEVFIPLDLPATTVTNGKEASLKFKLRWDPYVAQGIAVNKKYQLICVCRTHFGTLASSAWITVTRGNQP